MSLPPFIIFSCGVFFGIATLGVALAPSHHTLPKTFLDKDSHIIMYQYTPPMKVLLSFEPRKEFEAHGPGLAKSLQKSYKIDGYTDIYAQPYCVVHLPAAMLIEYTPALGDAKWFEKDDGDTIAHELLHCIQGSWHPDWEKIVEDKQ